MAPRGVTLAPSSLAPKLKGRKWEVFNNCSTKGDVHYSPVTDHSDTKNYICCCLHSVWFSETAAFLGEFGLSPTPAVASSAPEEDEKGKVGMLNPSSMAIPDSCLYKLILILEVCFIFNSCSPLSVSWYWLGCCTCAEFLQEVFSSAVTEMCHISGWRCWLEWLLDSPVCFFILSSLSVLINKGIRILHDNISHVLQIQISKQHYYTISMVMIVFVQSCTGRKSGWTVFKKKICLNAHICKLKL